MSTPMASSLVLALLVVFSWVTWKLFRNYVVRSPLDNIPGPERTSFWIGGHSWFRPRAFLKSYILAGHVKNMFDRHGWDFLDMVAAYGPVAKIYTALGVRIRFCAAYCLLTIPFLDPGALRL